MLEVTRQGGKREPLDKAVAFQIGKNGMILSFEVFECGCLVNLVPIGPILKALNALLKLESSDLSLIIRFAKTTISISRQGTIAKAMNVWRLPERVGKG